MLPKKGIVFPNGENLGPYALAVAYALIPSPIDQNPCAHWRNPMDMMRQG